MQSMTGYGKGQCAIEGRTLVVELKSVNSRFLELSIKMPRCFNFAEDYIRKTLKERLARGHVDVYINYLDQSTAAVARVVDEKTVADYLRAAEKLAEMGVENDLTVSKLLTMKDVLVESATEADEAVLRELLQTALPEAIEALKLMRGREGEELKRDICARLDFIEERVEEIAAFAPQVTTTYRARLEQRMRELLGESAVDESRLLQEVALYADKVNIDEEITRLRSHIKFFRRYMEGNNGGQSPNHWTQELLRETNTIGSKANSAYLTELVVSIKNEIEKIREQVQNLE